MRHTTPPRRLKVYVSHPYTGNETGNVASATLLALKVIRRGHNPFVPLLSHYMDTAARTAGWQIPYETWLHLVAQWLESCDAFLYTRASPGVMYEMELAEQYGIPIYIGVDDLPAAPEEFVPAGPNFLLG